MVILLVVPVPPIWILLEVTLPNLASPKVPLNTSEVLVASGINANEESVSSNPKKPSFASVPLCHLNSIPLSLPSSDPGAVSPPNVNIGSSIVTIVEFTVVVLPLTTKFPVTVKLFPTVTLLGKPTVTVSPDTEVSISFDVPAIVRVSVSKETPSSVPLSAAIFKVVAIVLLLMPVICPWAFTVRDGIWVVLPYEPADTPVFVIETVDVLPASLLVTVIPVPPVTAPPTVSNINSSSVTDVPLIYGLCNTNLPVPFGSITMFPLVSLEDNVLPFRSKLSTFKLSNLEFESTINALLAVRAPCEWSSKSVKYLPPIISTPVSYTHLTLPTNREV